MPISKSYQKQFSDALNDAFERADLERIVDFDLGVRYENVVRQGGTFSNECDDIIRWADKHDRLDELRLAAYAANPDNQTLLAFVKHVDVGFIEAHINAADLSKGKSDADAAKLMEALPPETGLQASVVAASLGEQTISLALAIKKQLEARRRICVIEVPGRSIGTGFLIGPRQVLTNRHVLDVALSLDSANIQAVFDYSGDQSYESLPRKNILLDASVQKDEVDGLDYAVLPLDSDVEADRGFFTPCPQRLGDKSSVTIMGHPAQDEKAKGLQYSWGMIRDINDQAKRIAYTAQTGPGSSGSPIFNANFELVGLHHHGQAGVNNHGIPIWAIAESLRLKGCDLPDSPTTRGKSQHESSVATSNSTDLKLVSSQIESARVDGSKKRKVSWRMIGMIVSLAIAIFSAYQFVVWLSTTPTEEQPVSRYFGEVTEQEGFTEWLVYKAPNQEPPPELQDAYKNISRRADNVGEDKVSVYLFVGDIFHFIGEKTRTSLSGPVSPPYNIDAVILSTNVDLAWGMGKDSEGKVVKYTNPQIQGVLWDQLMASKSQAAKNANSKIADTFAKRGPVSVLVDPIMVGPLEDFSPRWFCFLAADRKDGGTYNDEKFLKEKLTERNLSDGVYNALDQLDTAGAQSVVLPFIASSKPEYRNDLTDIQKNEMKIERLNISLRGTLRGISQFLNSKRAKMRSISEIGIVIWNEDVKGVCRGKSATELQEADNQKSGMPALKKSLLDSFDKQFP